LLPVVVAVPNTVVKALAELALVTEETTACRGPMQHLTAPVVEVEASVLPLRPAEMVKMVC
jgi:hypothetical protein